MNATFGESFDRLKRYCEKENYKGWDPFDGLSARLFQAIPVMRNNRYARLAWIQFFKRSPVNLRMLAGVPKDYNAKGLGLFLTGYCNLYRQQPQEDHLTRIHWLAEKIISLQSPGYSGSCWGYYFDWQARAFFQPKQMPTVVATSFVADALLHAYEITRKEQYKEVALSSARFVLHDLNRTYDKTGDFSFSYSPMDSSQVFNASLLGARLLSRAWHYTRQPHLKEEAAKAVRFVCKHQQSNGSWAYGTLPFHSWVDNFHTGFNLECIYEYQQYTGDEAFQAYVEKGFSYYIDTFFTPEGIAKYYNNQLYPVDIHAPAQLLVTLVKLNRLDAHQGLAEKVLDWTITHMQHKKGYFYYQRKKWFSSSIPYMRWAQAWMFYAMTYYLTATKQIHA
jgi:rhamnogalacturonyl hydrolase YesR